MVFYAKYNKFTEGFNNVYFAFLLAQDSEEIATQEVAENDTAEEKPDITDQQIGKLVTRTRLIACVEDK